MTATETGLLRPPRESSARRPKTALAGQTGDYRGVANRFDCPVRRLELPRGQLVLVLACGAPLALTELGGQRGWWPLQGFLLGPAHVPVLSEHRGHWISVEVYLPPWFANGLLGVSPRDLGTAPVAIDDVWGVEAPRLLERLDACATWASRFHLVEAFLARRLGPPPCGPLRELRWAWQVLVRSGGQVPVNGLAAALGWSHRRFTARFRDATGMAPKAAARRLRFACAARALVTGSDQRGLCAIAADCGYSDQSHMTREFVAQSGYPPAALARVVQRASP